MSKKDFIALADVVRGFDMEAAPETVEGIINSLANFCASENPRFNRKRWLGYIAGECGPNGGKAKVSK